MRTLHLAALAAIAALAAGCNDAPNITGISPSSGALAGGSQVTVSGQGFTPTSKVYVGGQPCTGVQYSTNTSVSSPSSPVASPSPNPDGTFTPTTPQTPTTSTTTTLTAIVPAGTSLGLCDVTVVNRDGQRAHLKNGYNYVGIPQVTSFTPSQNLAGGQETVNGSGFETGVSVNFGGTLATITGVTGSAITLTVPTQPAGQSVVTVTVTNPDGGSTSSTFTYGVPPASGSTQTTTTTSSSAPTITTVAGSATKGFAGDGGAATAAQLSGPSGVVVLSNGSIVIADTGNNRIRQVDSAGTITTIAGTGVAGFADGALGTGQLDGPTGLAVDSSDEVSVADTGNSAVRLLASRSLSTVAGSGTAGNTGDSGLATAALLSGPLAVALDSQRNLFVADTGNNRVRRVDVATKNIANFAGQSTGVGGFAGDGGAATSASLSAPSGVAVDSLGALYVADRGNVRVRKVDSSGTITTFAGTGQSGFAGDGGPATAASFGTIGRLALDASGSLYVADTSNERVRVISASSLSITTLAGNGTAGLSGDGTAAASASLDGPAGVFVTSTGGVLIADSGDGSVREVR